MIREHILKIFPGFEKKMKYYGYYKNDGERKSFDVDVIALNEKRKEILFAECKWQNRVNAKKIMKELAEKTEYVQWHNENRKESFAIFAKGFSKRVDEFKGRKVRCFDLRDLENLLIHNIAR